MRACLLLGMLAAAAGISSSALAAEHTTDSLDMVKKAVADGAAVLLDVREESEWNEGHLRDARLLPLSTLNGDVKVADLAAVAPRNKIIYCHCRSGVRCLKAADALRKLGYDARPLKAGFKDLLKAGFPEAQGPDSRSKRPAFEVRWSGELKNIRTKGDLRGTIELESVTRLPHLYALGALEDMRGEVTILDGIASVARVDQGNVVTSDVAEGKASTLVYAQVEHWKAITLGSAINSLGELETFAVEAARKEGIDVGRPFPFLVKGKIHEAKYHVLRHPGQIEDPMQLHEKAKVHYTLNDTQVDLVGFYSNQHAGVFTCCGNLHVHLRSADGKVSGHLDEFVPGSTMRLYLPAVADAERERARASGK